MTKRDVTGTHARKCFGFGGIDAVSSTPISGYLSIAQELRATAVDRGNLERIEHPDSSS